MKIHTYRKHRAFTLIELLVTIAILAVLATVVVVGTRLAKSSANAAKTTANMKSIGTTLQIFIDEGLDTGSHPRGTFPPYAGSLDDGQNTSFIWWELVAEDMGIAERESGSFDWKEHPNQSALQNPLSTKKLGGSGSTFNGFNSSANTRGSYAYNAQLGGDLDGPDETLSTTLAVANIEDGSNTIVFAESDDDAKGPGYYFTSTVDDPQGNYKDSTH